MELFMQNYALVFIVGLLTGVLTLMLRAFVITAVQAALLAVMPVLPDVGMLLSILSVVQVLLSGWILFKMVKVIDMGYRLVLEKTH
ncbi:hypothetical protein [Lentibacillus juripiscarius]|uniref:Uncharacterized protein n=1 Tax=Lentibacillus juripiscarius TaxID=257446 RepID=A0ABW5V678_9BACI